MNKFIRIIKKVLKGEDVTKVRFSVNQWDDQFDSGRWNFLLRTPYNVSVIAHIIKNIAAKKTTLKILDIGCGNGALARELADDSILYIGTDISSVALEQAKKIAPHGTYICTSMDTNPELHDTYDVIVFSEVLLYGDYEKILLIHKKYLKSDGLMIVSLYDTWRTKIIWWHVRKQLSTIESIFVKDTKRGTGWNIVLGKLI